MSGLDKIFSEVTMESAFVAEIRRRFELYLDKQYVDVLDLINMIRLEAKTTFSTEENQRLRKIYDLILEKRQALKEGEENLTFLER